MKYHYLLLVLLCIIEVTCQTYGQHYIDKDISAILYLLSGMAIGVLALFQPEPRGAENVILFPKTTKWFLGLAMLFISIAVWLLGSSLFEQNPMDYKMGDMLPIIQIMGERWLVGQDVYAIIPEMWEGMMPIYLPAMWLPYTTMIALGVDMRFMNLVFILLAVFLILDIPSLKKNKGQFFYLLLIPLLILLSYVFITYSTLITLTEEPIVIGFYILLGYAIIKDKPVMLIIALSSCLLSRYALVFWAATYLGYSFFHLSQRRTLAIGIGTAALSLFLLYISQGIYQLELFISLKDAYLNTLTNPDEAWGVVNVTQKNIGLARFFDPSQLPALHAALFWGALFIPPALYIWYHYKGRQWINPQWFAICSLKLSLVWFFNMNAMPYSYLFYTSTFMSLLIVAQYQRQSPNSK